MPAKDLLVRSSHSRRGEKSKKNIWQKVKVKKKMPRVVPTSFCTRSLSLILYMWTPTSWFNHLRAPPLNTLIWPIRIQYTNLGDTLRLQCTSHEWGPWKCFRLVVIHLLQGHSPSYNCFLNFSPWIITDPIYQLLRENHSHWMLLDLIDHRFLC